MKILVIGGAGFIGEQLTRHLCSRGHFVRVVDLPHRKERLADLATGQIEYYGADFSTLQESHPAFSEIEVVIHLASTSAPQTSMVNLEKDASANILSSIRILQGATKAGASLFLYSSSGGTIYGNSRVDKITEDHPTNPISSYGICKLAIEKYMGVFAQSSNLRAIALRISNAYGPGQLIGVKVGLIAACLRKLLAGEEIEILGDGTSVRDYIFVSDIVTAFEVCLTNPNLKSGAYNIGSEKGYSVKEVLDMIQKVSHRSLRVRYLPARGFDVRRTVLDTTRFREATGWAPKIDLQQGTSILWEEALARFQVAQR